MAGPKLEFSDGIVADVGIFDTLLDDLFNNVTLVDESATEAVFETSDGKVITVTGTDLAYDGSGDERQLVGGTFTDLRFDIDVENDVYVEMSGVNFDILEFATAYVLDAGGFNPSAIEDLLMPLDWEIEGNDGPTSFLKGRLSSDGVPLTFSGDNEVYLEGGADKFDAGAGDDSVSGGRQGDVLWGRGGEDTLNGNQGADTLYGGSDNDTLKGGGGADVLFGGGQRDDLNGGRADDRLYGGDQRDTLNGAKGDDSLFGGSGSDTLIGGTGDDTLNGGSGADRFVFNETAEAQADVITDFDVIDDKIRIYGASEESATFTDQSGDLLVTFGTNTLLIENTDQSDLDSANFLFL